MQMEFRCRDLGIDCDFVACASTEGEMFEKAGDHARKAHDKKNSQEIYDKAAAAIHDVPYCEPSD